MSKILLLLGAISVLSPCALDLYLPALPAIATDLNASAAAVQLTLPVFFLGLALSQLLFGSLADHLGRRLPLLCGIGLLVLGSVGCALAPDVTTLMAWRLVQASGVGSATVIPRAIVRDLFEVAHTARALSLLGLISGVGPILAPQVGALILHFANWRYEFWMLTALGTACWIAAFFNLAESIPAERAGAMGPRLWFALLTDRRYLRYALPANLMQCSLFAYLAGAPFVFIDYLKLTPPQFAWTFGCNAIGVMLAGRINARLVVRHGPDKIFRRSMVASLGLGVILVGVAFWHTAGFWALAIPLFLFIATLGFNFANGLALALQPFATSAGTASAVFGTLLFALAGVAGAAVSRLYDGTAQPMTGVMLFAAAAAVAAYRAMNPSAPSPGTRKTKE